MRTTSLRASWALLGLSSLAAGAPLACSDRADDCSVTLHCGGASGGGAGGSSGVDASGGRVPTGGALNRGGNAAFGGVTGSGGSSAGRGGQGQGGRADDETGGAGGAGGETSQGGSPAGGAGGGADETGGAAGTGNAGEGGVGGEGGGGPLPCDATAAPSAEPCLVEETYAVFVAPSGSDTASGTRSTPVQSLAKGIELATAQKKFVIACNAVYAAPLAITTSVKLYGGFGCPGSSGAWSHVPTGVARVAPSAKGVALSVRSVTQPLEIHDFEFQSLDATLAGESSVAALVVDSPNVTLRRVRLLAGAGKSGQDATTPAFTFPEVATLQGNAGTSVGGTGKACSCPDGSMTSGGPGGSPPDQNGGSGGPEPEGPGGEGGDTTLACASGGGGSDGISGASSNDAAGAITLGKLNATTWIPSTGSTGTAGAPGQGGGGGAGNPSGGGGGGGCGGCGGNGGPGGQGGGASIALLAIASPLVFDGGALISGAAGNGGKGGAGQLGQTTFGGGGDGKGTGNPGCDGGNGGPGGNGGSGGGGAGGISVGVLYSGVSPSLSGLTAVTFGTAGLAGPGGKAGVNDGIVGVARATLAAP